jgi:hypothetical protein
MLKCCNFFIPIYVWTLISILTVDLLLQNQFLNQLRHNIYLYLFNKVLVHSIQSCILWKAFIRGAIEAGA